MVKPTVVDCFAGWGGATLGAEQAGCEVVWAIDNWQLAKEAHQLNFPKTHYALEDIRNTDWSKVPECDLLWASPPCPGHSSASQAKRTAGHDDMNDLAWCVTRAVQRLKPEAFIVENVTHFLYWEPLFRWIAEFERLGYQVSRHVVKATSHSVPQARRRMFVTGTKASSPYKYKPGRHTNLMVGDYLQLDQGVWKPIAEAGPSAKARMQKAVQRWGSPCISQHTSNHAGLPLTAPIGTITGREHWVIVRGDEYRLLLPRELARLMGFPDSFILPNCSGKNMCLGIGNAVPPPVARDLICELLNHT